MSTTITHTEKKTSAEATRSKTLAPKLRYKGYNESWVSKILGEVCEKIQDGNYGAEYPTSDEFVQKGIPFLTSKALGGDGFIKVDKIDFIPIEKHNKLKKAHLKLHDVLFTNRGSNVGSIGFTDERIAHGNIGPQLTLLRSDLNIVFPMFLYQIMLSHPLRKQVNSQDSGSAMNFFGIGVTSKFKLNIPTLPEQQKIASFLSAVDEKIQQLTRKKELLEQYKKGVMQQLFSGKLRFKPDAVAEGTRSYPKWEDISIGEIFKFKQGVQAAVEEQLFEQPKNFIRFIRIVDLTKNDEPIRFIKDPGDEHRVEKEDLFMVRYGNPGVVGFGYEGVIANNLFRILPVDKRTYINFFKYWFEYIKKDLDALASSSTMPALNFGSLNTLKLKLPIIGEQKKIADYLSNIDNKIESVNKQITQTQTFKKGLLQQMFV